MTSTQNEQYDVVIVGSGAAGLTAAITAAKLGLSVLVIEKASVWGGTSALSGGGIWAPANRLQREAGINDSVEEAAKYLDGVITDEGPATSIERRMAFLNAAPKMVDALIDAGMRWTCDHLHPDYNSDKPHAGIGRDLDSQFFNAKKLGPWLKTMRRGPAPYAIRLKDIQPIAQGVSSLRSFSHMAFIFFRHKIATAIGQAPTGCGESLVAQLMTIAIGLKVKVVLDTPLRELVMEDGRVTGVIVGKDGSTRRIGARGGIMLGAGGFAHDDKLRQETQGISGRWSSASPDDTGDIVKMANGIGAMTALLDEAWWGSALVYPGDIPVFCQWERSLPFSIVVDDKGQRFTDEAEDYHSFGKSMLRHKVDHAWLIMDARHRKRYTFGGFFPGRTPQAMIDCGFFKKSDTLEGIARECGVDPAGLVATVKRFNEFVRNGVDEDFKRGGEPYDRYWGDPTIKPNPNLGTLEKAPFLAAKLCIGDLGTKGGYVTNPNGQVLDVNGVPIEGLYAAGNSTASVMGRTYPGPGVTLGPAMTFGYIAMQHAARRITNRPIETRDQKLEVA